jgi:hypothetical protein
MLTRVQAPDLFDTVRRNLLMARLGTLRAEETAALSRVRTLLGSEYSAGRRDPRSTRQIDITVHSAAWVLMADDGTDIGVARLEDFSTTVIRHDDSSSKCWLSVRVLRLINEGREDVFRSAIEPLVRRVSRLFYCLVRVPLLMGSLGRWRCDCTTVLQAMCRCWWRTDLRPL